MYSPCRFTKIRTSNNYKKGPALKINKVHTPKPRVELKVLKIIIVIICYISRGQPFIYCTKVILKSYTC